MNDDLLMMNVRILQYRFSARCWFIAQAVLSIVLLHSCCCGKCSPLPQLAYTIGGWIPGTESSFLSKWKPILGTYLTSEVGALYDPPITFELISADYHNETSFENLISAGTIDFVCKSNLFSFNSTVPAECQLTYLNLFSPDTISGEIACLIEQFQYLPLATQRVVFNGMESTAYGAVIVSSLTASSITNISSISNMRIGVGFVQGAGAYKLPYQVLNIEKDLIRICNFSEYQLELDTPFGTVSPPSELEHFH